MAGQCIGAGEMERARETAKTGLRLNLTVTLVVVAAVQLLAEPLVRLFDDSEQVVRDGVLYLRLCCGANSLVYAAMYTCLLYTSPSPRDGLLSRMPSSA